MRRRPRFQHLGDQRAEALERPLSGGSLSPGMDDHQRSRLHPHACREKVFDGPSGGGRRGTDQRGAQLRRRRPRQSFRQRHVVAGFVQVGIERHAARRQGVERVSVLERHDAGRATEVRLADEREVGSRQHHVVPACEEPQRLGRYPGRGTVSGRDLDDAVDEIARLQEDGGRAPWLDPQVDARRGVAPAQRAQRRDRRDEIAEAAASDEEDPPRDDGPGSGDEAGGDAGGEPRSSRDPGHSEDGSSARPQPPSEPGRRSLRYEWHQGTGAPPVPDGRLEMALQLLHAGRPTVPAREFPPLALPPRGVGQRAIDRLEERLRRGREVDDARAPLQAVDRRRDDGAAGGQVLVDLQRAARAGELVGDVRDHAHGALAQNGGQVLVRLIAEEVDVRLGLQPGQVDPGLGPAREHPVRVAAGAGTRDQQVLVETFVDLADEGDLRSVQPSKSRVGAGPREAPGGEMRQVRRVGQEVRPGVNLSKALEEPRGDGQHDVGFADQSLFRGADPLAFGDAAVTERAELVHGVVEARVGVDPPQPFSRSGVERDDHRPLEAQGARNGGHGGTPAPAIESVPQGGQIAVRVDEQVARPRTPHVRERSATHRARGLPRADGGFGPLRVDVEHAMPPGRQPTHQLLLAGPAIIPVLLPETNDVHASRSFKKRAAPVSLAKGGWRPSPPDRRERASRWRGRCGARTTFRAAGRGGLPGWRPTCPLGGEGHVPCLQEWLRAADSGESTR